MSIELNKATLNELINVLRRLPEFNALGIYYGVALKDSKPNFSLSSQELTILNTYKSYERKEDFINGRLAIKDALGNCKLFTTEEINCSSTVNEKNGAPVTKILDQGNIITSITHKKGQAIAACSINSQLLGIGIDLEHLNHRPRPFNSSQTDRMVKLVGTKEELTIIEDLFVKASLSYSPHELFITLFCIKEAAFKALGSTIAIFKDHHGVKLLSEVVIASAEITTFDMAAISNLDYKLINFRLKTKILPYTLLKATLVNSLSNGIMVALAWY